MSATTFPVGSLVTIKGHGSEVFAITELWNDEDDGTACAYLDSESGGTFGEDAAIADLTLVMSAEKAAKRRLPTPEEFAKENDWMNLSWGQEFEIDGSDQEGDGKVMLYGKTADGLRFGALVHVLLVESADF